MQGKWILKLHGLLKNTVNNYIDYHSGISLPWFRDFFLFPKKFQEILKKYSQKAVAINNILRDSFETPWNSSGIS